MSRLLLAILLLSASRLLGAAEPAPPITINGCPGVLRLQPGVLHLQPPGACQPVDAATTGNTETRLRNLEAMLGELLTAHPELFPIRRGQTAAGVPQPATR